MNFIKKIWKKGDKVTSKQLNRIEDGIEQALNNNQDNPILDNNVVYITIETDNIDNLEDTDGAAIPAENFSSSLEDIFNKVLNQEQIILKVQYVESYSNRGYTFYLNPKIIINDNQRSCVYFDTGFMGAMYLCGTTDPTFGFNINITKQNNSNTIQYFAFISKYDFYQ